jgi:hypothetical protein
VGGSGCPEADDGQRGSHRPCLRCLRGPHDRPV